MANNIGWGQGAVNNNIGWGQGASSNSISWGISQKDSYSGETEIYGIRGDVDALAFNSRVTSNGGALSTLEQTAINQLVVDLKAYGLWDSMKAIYPMVGASAAACAQNLKSSSFTGTFTSGWTFASTGATPNGTNAYMDTGLIPSVDLTQNSTHLSYYSRTNSLTGNVIDMGTSTGPTGTSFRTYILMRFGGVSYSSINSASDNIVTTITDTRKFLLAYRNNSLNYTNQVNSTQQTIASVSTGLSDKSIYIAAWNKNGTADNFSLRETAFNSIGYGLTDTQAANFYTAVQAFQTTLSRQV
jgi:hypothetical protein